MMKRLLILLLSLTMVASTLMTSAVAAERSSDYISKTQAELELTPSGYLQMTYSVTGTGTMESIGALKVELYEGSGGTWRIARTYHASDNPDMMGENTTIYDYSMPQLYKGIEGYSYYMRVTAYAENSAGFDSKAFFSNVVIVE